MLFILNKAYYVTDIEVNAKIEMEYICNVLDIRTLCVQFWTKNVLQFSIKPSRDPDLRRDLTLRTTALDTNLHILICEKHIQSSAEHAHRELQRF
jgi:hypothetical protein